ncbi:MAG: (Fe-S)-binding protein [Eubacterium sp.]
MEKVYATDIYEYLPHSNCKRCGEDGCMAFADKLAKMEAHLSSCAPLRLDEQKQNKEAINALFNL